MYVSLSNPDNVSSKTITCFSCNIALINANLCFCPPDKLLLSMKDKTVIHISHRSYPETLNMYDEVYVMGSDSKIAIS